MISCTSLSATSYQVKYDPEQHGSDVETYYNSDNVECTNVRVRECKFGYGKQLLFGEPPEFNLTRGAERVDDFQMQFDSNGQAKATPLRNHGRVVPYCYPSCHWGANNDIQFILMPKHWDNLVRTGSNGEPLPKLTRVEIEHISNMLCAMKRSGLDPANSLHIVNRYLTSYCCKGGHSSAHWCNASQSIIMAYCSQEGNESKTLRSIVAKLMLEISQSMTMARDQALFLGAGGKLKKGLTVVKTSVSATSTSDLSAAAAGQQDPGAPPFSETVDPKVQNRFNLLNIFKRYKQRSNTLSGLSVYEFSISHWKDGKELVPYFFGYYNIPKWPLCETFSKWTLILHRPWRTNPDEVKGHSETYAEALVEYLLTEECRVPDLIWNEILRVKRKEREVSVDASAAISGNADVLSPSNERTDERLDDAAAAMPAPTGGENPHDFQDFTDHFVKNLRKPPPGYDWSANYNDRNQSALQEYIDKRREAGLRRRLGGGEEPLELFDEPKYRPENARSYEQKFLVYHHLYHHWLRWTREHNPELAQTLDLPEDKTQLVWVEGLPGMSTNYVFCHLRQFF